MATQANATDLNCMAPGQCAQTLRAAADAYRESAYELASSWQDEQAGQIWSKLAAILDRAADQCDTAVAREFGERPTKVLRHARVL